MSSLRDELIHAVGEQHVSQLPNVVAPQMPIWRVAPGSAAEAAEVIRRTAARGGTIHPIGTGSRAAPPVGDPARQCVVVTTSRLDNILQLDEQSLLVHAQAGLTGRALQQTLSPRGLSIGDYPPDLLTSSLGGIVAMRAPSKSSARHGFFEEAIVGVSAVIADGRSVHTRVCPRRSTGPDLAHVLFGNEGTIGLITSMVLRIHTKPESRLLAAYLLPSIDAAIHACFLALREEASPSGLRIIDAAEVARQFDDVRLAPEQVLLCAATAGPTDLAVCDRDLIASAVLAEGGEVTDDAPAELWWRRLHADEPTPGPPPTLEIMATPSKIASVYRAVAETCANQSVAMAAHISRFGPDGAVTFFTLDAPTANDSPDTASIERAAEAAGGWLLGARPTKLDAYLRSLRDALDPYHVMGHGPDRVS